MLKVDHGCLLAELVVFADVRHDHASVSSISHIIPLNFPDYATFRTLVQEIFEKFCQKFLYAG